MNAHYYPCDFWRLSETGDDAPPALQFAPIVSWRLESFFGHLLKIRDSGIGLAVDVYEQVTTAYKPADDEPDRLVYLTWVPAYLSGSMKMLLPGENPSDGMRVLFLRPDAAPEMRFVMVRTKEVLDLLDGLKNTFVAEFEQRVIKVTGTESFNNSCHLANPTTSPTTSLT